ncbi:unnamed protein product, partial [Ectocarpus sp. 12 AP-2014]
VGGELGRVPCKAIVEPARQARTRKTIQHRRVRAQGQVPHTRYTLLGEQSAIGDVGTSIRSAPPVVGEMLTPGANIWRRAGATFGPGGGCEASLDQRSDLSDYSFFAVASEVSENGSTGRLVEGGRENGTGRRRARDNNVVAGETSDTSAGCESEIRRRVLTSKPSTGAPTRTRRRGKTD